MILYIGGSSEVINLKRLLKRLLFLVFWPAIMESLKWKIFSKAAVVEMAAALEGIGVDIHVTDDNTKEEVIAALEFLEITPQTALQAKFGAGAASRDAVMQVVSVNKKKELPKLQPQGKDEKIDELLRRFKVWVAACQVPKEEWVRYLWGALSPQAGGTLSSMEEGDASDFDKVEVFLKKQFQITPEEQLLRFRREKPRHGETFTQFGSRLKEYLQGFLKLSSSELEEGNKLVMPMLCEQMLNCAGDELRSQVRRKLEGDWTCFTKIVEAFEIEHEILRNKKRREEAVSSKSYKSVSHESTEGPQRQAKRCYNCQEIGHLAFNCLKNANQGNSQEGH